MRKESRKITNQAKKIVCLIALAVLCISKTFAALSITVPSLTINTCSIYPTQYHLLGNIVISEGSSGADKAAFAIGTNVTLVLTAPAKFEFQAGSGDVSVGAANDISTATITVTATTITVTYTVTGTSNSDAMTIGGIYVRGITSASAAVNVTRTGGTGVITGLGNGITVATLTSTDVNNTLTAGTTVASSTNPVCNNSIIILSLSGSTPDVGSYQWQSATAVGGPYTNITGATTNAYNYTPTVASTLFFRCTLLGCGTAPSANSTPVQVTSQLCDCTTGASADLVIVAVNLSSRTDTTYTFSGKKKGVACGGSNCIRFDVTTNPGTNQVGFDVAPAPVLMPPPIVFQVSLLITAFPAAFSPFVQLSLVSTAFLALLILCNIASAPVPIPL